MELIGVITLILGVLGALAFIRINKLEGYLRNKGVLDDGFDSLNDLDDWSGTKQSHER